MLQCFFFFLKKKNLYFSIAHFFWKLNGPNCKQSQKSKKVRGRSADICKKKGEKRKKITHIKSMKLFGYLKFLLLSEISQGQHKLFFFTMKQLKKIFNFKVKS